MESPPGYFNQFVGENVRRCERSIEFSIEFAEQSAEAFIGELSGELSIEFAGDFAGDSVENSVENFTGKSVENFAHSTRTAPFIFRGGFDSRPRRG